MLVSLDYLTLNSSLHGLYPTRLTVNQLVVKNSVVADCGGSIPLFPTFILVSLPGWGCFAVNEDLAGPIPVARAFRSVM